MFTIIIVYYIMLRDSAVTVCHTARFEMRNILLALGNYSVI